LRRLQDLLSWRGEDLGMRQAILGFLALLVLGLAGPAQAQFFFGYSLSAEEIGLIETAVSADITDKESIRFSGLRAAHDGSTAVAVCGFVNSRGPDGLLTGNVPFFGGMAYSPHIQLHPNFTLVAVGEAACQQCLHMGNGSAPSATCWTDAGRTTATPIP
jgi:hypothetical protein